MATKTLSSPLVSAFNNIGKLGTSAKMSAKLQSDFMGFLNFIEMQNAELNRIELPEERKIKRLANLNIASTFGSPGGLLSSLASGALDLAGFLGNFFPGRGKQGKPQPDKGIKSPKVTPRGKRIRFGGVKGLGVLNALFAGLDFYQGLQEGESVGKAATGAGASLAGSIIGGILGSPLGPLGSIAGAALGGMVAGWAGDRVYEASTGGSKSELKRKQEQRLKEQEQKQKSLVGDKSFSDVLNKFSMAVDKFERGVSQGLFGTISESNEMQENPYQEPTEYPDFPDTDETYDGPISGDTFFPLPGGDVGTKGKISPYQAFGAPRDGGSRKHAGIDMTHWTGPLDAPVVAYRTGKVVWASPSGSYNSGVMVDHGNGIKTKYFHVTPLVKTGDIVYGGQQIAKLFPAGNNTHLHFEYHKGGTPINPMSAGITKTKRLPAPLPKDKAKQHSESNKSDVDVKQKSNGIEMYPQQTESTVKKPEEVKTPPVKNKSMVNFTPSVQSKPADTTTMISAAPQQNNVPQQVNTIQYYPSYNQGQYITTIVPMLMGNNSSNQRPIVVSGGSAGSEVVLLPPPSEGEIVNDLLKTMLLTNLSGS